MSGITGKGATSIKKQEVKESRIPAIGFNKIRFLHKLTAGATSISLTSLTAPSISEAPNYSAPNVSQLTAVNLAQFPDNLELVSSSRGRLIRNMAFDIAGASTITLLYPADDGEILEGVIDPVAVTGNTIVDAKPLVASGVLTLGTTDFNVGEPFEVGKFPLTQHGSVLVFLDNQLMYRNTGNQAPGPSVEGDYYEVHAGAGLGTIIRFNTPDLVNDRNVSVISVAALAERPNGSMMAFIENVSGKVDSMIPSLAALAEVDESTFGGVTNVDLKAFGDRVLLLEGILNLSVPNVSNITTWSPTGSWTSTATYSGWKRQVGDVMEYTVVVALSGAATATNLSINLPVSDVMDGNKIPISGTTRVGEGEVYDSSTGHAWTCKARIASTTAVNIRVDQDGTAIYDDGAVNNTFPWTWASGDSVTVTFRVPIVGLQATQTIRQLLGL